MRILAFLLLMTVSVFAQNPQFAPNTIVGNPSGVKATPVGSTVLSPLVLNNSGLSCPTCSTSVGANPIAQVGLTTVNGVASTYMRSDAAPALDTSAAFQFTNPAMNTPFLQNGTGATNITVQSVLKRIISAADFTGFDPTGVSDSSAAVQNCLNAIGATGGTCQVPQSAKVRILSTITFPSSASLQCGMPRSDNPSGLNSSITYDILGGIRLASSATLTLGANSGLLDCMIIRDGMTFPASGESAFAGTAITLTLDSPVLSNLLVMGFNNLVAQTGTQISRITIKDFYGDGVNGIYLTLPSYDSSTYQNIHLWPFSSSSVGTQAALTRSGYGIYINSNQDDSFFDNILTYGYLYGMSISNAAGFHIGKLWTDYPIAYAVGSGSRGLNVGSSATNIKIGDFWAWSMDQGVVLIMDATTNITFAQAHVQGTASAAINIVSGGYARFDDVTFNTIGTYSFIIGSSSTYLYARGIAQSIGAVELISLPSGAKTNQIDVNLVSDKAVGSFLYGTNTIDFPTLASAATLQLPINGYSFKVSGVAAINTLSAFYGGRVVNLQFTSTATLTSSGNIVLASGSIFQGAAGAEITLVYDSVSGKWTEWSRTLPPAAANQVVRMNPAGTTLEAGSVNLASSAAVTGLLPNANLANSATTVNGQTCTLGSTCMVAAAAGTLTGGTLASGVTASSLTSFGNAPTIANPIFTGTVNASGPYGSSSTSAVSVAGGTISSATGTITTATGTWNYKVLGKYVDYSLTVTVTNAGTGGGYLRVQSPFTTANYVQAATGVQGLISARAYLNAANNLVDLMNMDGSSLVANGVTVTITGRAEVP